MSEPLVLDFKRMQSHYTPQKINTGGHKWYEGSYSNCPSPEKIKTPNWKLQNIDDNKENHNSIQSSPYRYSNRMKKIHAK